MFKYRNCSLRAYSDTRPPKEENDGHCFGIISNEKQTNPKCELCAPGRQEDHEVLLDKPLSDLPEPLHVLSVTQEGILKVPGAGIGKSPGTRC